MDDLPVVLVDRGRPLPALMDEERVDRADIMEAAREYGLERMAQVKYAVLETNGKISIIPWRQPPGPHSAPPGEMVGG